MHPSARQRRVPAMEDVWKSISAGMGTEVLVCLDETSKQQVKETRLPRPEAASYAEPTQPFHVVRSLEGWPGWNRTGARKPIGPGWSSNWWTRTTRTRTVLCHPPNSAISNQPYTERAKTKASCGGRWERGRLSATATRAGRQTLQKSSTGRNPRCVTWPQF